MKVCIWTGDRLLLIVGCQDLNLIFHTSYSDVALHVLDAFPKLPFLPTGDLDLPTKMHDPTVEPALNAAAMNTK